MDTFDIYERMQALLVLFSLEEIWQHWQPIAQKVIPEGYTLEQASEEYCAEESDFTYPENLLERIDYFSDRLATPRAFWLDYYIRKQLGLPLPT